MKKTIFIALLATYGSVVRAEEINSVATSKEYVDTELSTKQPIIPAEGNNIVMTFDSNATDGIGTRQIYDESTSYTSQLNALVSADTANSAVQMAIDGEFVCTGYSDIDPNDCWFWSIRTNYIPDTYTRLESVTNPGSTGFDTGIDIDVDDFELEIRVKPSTGSWYIFQAREAWNMPIWGISGSVYGNTINFNMGATLATVTSEITRDTNKIYYIRGVARNGTATLYVNNETDNIADTVTGTYTFVPTTLHLGLFSNLSGGQNVSAGNTVYMARARKNGKLVMNYVPAMYNNTVGFYDTVSQTFKTPYAGSVIGSTPIEQNVYIPQNQQ